MTYAQQCIAQAQPHLQAYGQVATQYVTASMDRVPFGGEPDLVFVPAIGPNANVVYLMEFRPGQFGRLDTAWLKQAVDHQAQILATNPDVPIVYALVTVAALSPEQVAWCQAFGLRVLQHVTDGFELATTLLIWAGVTL